MLSPWEEAWPLSCPAAPRHGPVGLLHVDAHMDIADKALGEKIYHGTPFRRCVEEKLLDCKRVVQIGIRGSSMTVDPCRYSRNQVTGRMPFPLPPPAQALPLHCSLSGSHGLQRGCSKQVQKRGGRPSLHPEGHGQQRGARMLVHEAEAASCCWGGGTSRGGPTPGMLLSWERAGEVPTRGEGTPWFSLHTCWAEWTRPNRRSPRARAKAGLRDRAVQEVLQGAVLSF